MKERLKHLAQRAMRPGLAAIEGRLDSLAKRTASLEADIGARLDGVLGRLDSLAKRTASLEADIGTRLDVIQALVSPPPNPWWDDLKRSAGQTIFQAPAEEDFAACRRIMAAYDRVLEDYGVQREEFFAGSIKDADAAVLHALVRTRRPRLAWQVGTFAGYSALLIASALRDAGDGGILVCCDPEVPHRTYINPVGIAREMAAELRLDAHLRFERGWNALPMGDNFSVRFAGSIPVRGPDALRELGEIDFAFVDGDHSVAGTMCDLMLLQQHLAVGGVIVFHDVKSWPTVAHALHDFLNDIYFYYSGTRQWFAHDVFADGIDGLLAFERLGVVRNPLLRLTVLSDGGVPAAKAELTLPELSFVARVGGDGHVFYFGEVDAGQRLRVELSGFETLDEAVGVSTAGDYVERTVRLRRSA